MKFLIALTAFAALTLATPIAKGPHGHDKPGQGQPPAARPGDQDKGQPAAAAAAAAAQTTTTSSPTATSAATGSVNAALVPDFGITAGQGRQGNNCVGTNGVLIPCDCPPPKQQFIDKLNQFVQAGNAFRAPTPFPEDDSKQSQIIRLQTSIITLQNLNGAGVGCPAASTTFLAQKAALGG